jgi:hypothetical protein
VIKIAKLPLRGAFRRDLLASSSRSVCLVRLKRGKLKQLLDAAVKDGVLSGDDYFSGLRPSALRKLHPPSLRHMWG